MVKFSVVFAVLYVGFLWTCTGQQQFPFPAQVWQDTTDHTANMVQGISKFLDRQTAMAAKQRGKYWKVNFASADHFGRSIREQRELLCKRLGVVDDRAKPAMHLGSNNRLKPSTVHISPYTMHAVSWDVLGDMRAEGLLIIPESTVKGFAVILPDADMDPELFVGKIGNAKVNQLVVHNFVEAGMVILIPALVNRKHQFSGNARLNAWTTQPHREWLYRQSYELGRHIIGYELQSIFAGIDWFVSQWGNKHPVAMVGYGEGGMLALYAAAVDQRITNTIVSGYFSDRQQLWKEPIYRNIFGRLRVFGDAELALMVWPRQLVIEDAAGVDVDGTPIPYANRPKGSPGNLASIDTKHSKAEWDRAKSLRPKQDTTLHWVSRNNTDAMEADFSFFSNRAIQCMLKSMNLPYSAPQLPMVQTNLFANWVDTDARQARTIRSIENEIQRELAWCEKQRNQDFWRKLKGDTLEQHRQKEIFRQDLWNQLGRIPTPQKPFNTYAKQLEKTDKWTSYAIKLDVWDDVFTWGILLVPHDMEANEKRSVVVCQHGLEGLPGDVINADPNSKNFHFYKGFGSTLANKGYIVFAPANLYRGEDTFRSLQRQANPIGWTLFSVIIGQHQRITQWLKSLDFVDSHKIGFYGLSYGGKTAMRVPAVVEDYCLSICSGDFNEWVRKCTATDYPFSYMYTEEYDMQEWDLGHTFNYAEMAAIIAPRPFMVERGHFDGVAIDEWVGYEYEKVRRHYNMLQISDRTQIEYFLGPHTINGKGTFDFLAQFLPIHSHKN